MILASLGLGAGLAWNVRADNAQAGVRGAWTGPWYLGMTSGVARLTLTGEGALEGTLQMTNQERFGAEAGRLLQAAFDGGTLRFRVVGADGQALVADLPLSGDGTSLKGFAKYGGYNLRFELSRHK
jgi:hypothetical protein